MNFEAFQIGVYSLVMSISLSVSQVLMPSLPPPVSPSLQEPGTVESFDVVSENYNLELPQPLQEATLEAEPEPIEKVAVEIQDQEINATSEALVTVEKPIKPKIAVSTPPPAVIMEKQNENTISQPENKKAEVKKETKTPDKKPETITPKTIVSALSGSAEKLFQMANEHRAKLGLAAFEKEERICKIAEARAPQIYDEVFKNGPMHKGFKALGLPYWATENIAAYDSIEKNFSFWLRDGIHRQALEGPSKYSCVACAGSYCSQIFTSFIPK
jgi:uncharacterized protein YkwD